MDLVAPEEGLVVHGKPLYTKITCKAVALLHTYLRQSSTRPGGAPLNITTHHLYHDYTHS